MVMIDGKQDVMEQLQCCCVLQQRPYSETSGGGDQRRVLQTVADIDNNVQRYQNAQAVKQLRAQIRRKPDEIKCQVLWNWTAVLTCCS